MLEGLLVDLVPQGDAYRERLHEWSNSEGEFWGSGGERPFNTQAMIQRRIERWAERRGDSPNRGVYFAIRTKPGVLLGMMAVNWMNPTHRWGVLGAQISEPGYWSGGYGTDALLLLIDFAFDWLDFRRVWLTTTSMNARSQRQMEKVGFTLESRLREAAYADGVPYDLLNFGLLREEWAGRVVLIGPLNLREKVAALKHGEDRA
ncbi:MAG: GNAT family N-acetyltransferase [Anaerolineae bacterium]|nr:GNAT family N-acetyltransferase [Anaerolineae bacterium]